MCGICTMCFVFSLRSLAVSVVFIPLNVDMIIFMFLYIVRPDASYFGALVNDFYTLRVHSLIPVIVWNYIFEEEIFPPSKSCFY